MSAQTVTQRKFRCDSVDCRVAGIYENDAAAGMDGWALLKINGREYALCEIHRLKIEGSLERRA